MMKPLSCVDWMLSVLTPCLEKASRSWVSVTPLATVTLTTVPPLNSMPNVETVE